MQTIVLDRDTSKNIYGLPAMTLVARNDVSPLYPRDFYRELTATELRHILFGKDLFLKTQIRIAHIKGALKSDHRDLLPLIIEAFDGTVEIKTPNVHIRHGWSGNEAKESLRQLCTSLTKDEPLYLSTKIYETTREDKKGIMNTIKRWWPLRKKVTSKKRFVHKPISLTAETKERLGQLCGTIENDGSPNLEQRRETTTLVSAQKLSITTMLLSQFSLEKKPTQKQPKRVHTTLVIERI